MSFDIGSFGDAGANMVQMAKASADMQGKAAEASAITSNASANTQATIGAHSAMEKAVGAIAQKTNNESQSLERLV